MNRGKTKRRGAEVVIEDMGDETTGKNSSSPLHGATNFGYFDRESLGSKFLIIKRTNERPEGNITRDPARALNRAPLYGIAPFSVPSKRGTRCKNRPKYEQNFKGKNTR